jgi:PD-(D/E)XK endonuclease
MRKDARKSGRKRPPFAPFKRGSQTKKAKGELAELAFLHKAASMGFGVAKPYGDSERYDFILDSGERLWRVQVKSTNTNYGAGYCTMGCHSNNCKPYKANEIDFFVAYIIPRDIWYVIPVNRLPHSHALAFYPSGCRIGGYFESYREAWDLMAPGGDLKPQPPTMRRVHAVRAPSKWKSHLASPKQ